MSSETGRGIDFRYPVTHRCLDVPRGEDRKGLVGDLLCWYRFDWTLLLVTRVRTL